MIHHRVVESITKAFFDCILVILLLIVIILTTEVGLKVSVWFIQKSTDNKLSIESIKGSWLSNIEINGLKIKTQNISLLAKHINFSSKLIDLLELNLKLNGLTASDITIELKNLNNSKININNFYDAQSLLEKINIPIDFAANKIDLKNITIKQNSQDNIAIKSIQFQTTISKNILNINKLLIISAPYKIESNGMILLNKPFDCNINFTVFKNNIHYITADLNGNAKQKLSLKIYIYYNIIQL
jgi:autotransporter translocation and assembly factor TamB